MFFSKHANGIFIIVFKLLSDLVFLLKRILKLPLCTTAQLHRSDGQSLHPLSGM